MKIINVGDRIMNTWIYEIPGGYVMIDTGYPNKLKSVEKRMTRHGVAWSDIRYVFLTHAHDDHAGFLSELLSKYPEIKVILNPGSIPVLRKGQNSFRGGYSTFGAWLFCRCMSLWGKGKHLFPPLEERFDDRLLCIEPETIDTLEGLLRGRILFTPGHTNDSVSQGRKADILRRCRYERISEQSSGDDLGRGYKGIWGILGCSAVRGR